MPDKRIALVTGPNQGVGLQVAKELVANGVTVLVGSRNFERGEAAAKAALNAITLAMMVELDSTGIKVNLVSPGLTRTNLNGNPGTQSVEEGSREVLRVRCSARTAVGYVHALGRRDDTVGNSPFAAGTLYINYWVTGEGASPSEGGGDDLRQENS